MDKHTIRTFFAIGLPIPIMEQIENELFGLMNSNLQNIKWVSFNLMHITLKFIGKFNPDHQSSMQKDLCSHLGNFGKIKLSFGGLGAFPDIKKPRIVWLNLKEHGQLIRLARVIDLITSNYGYHKEKRSFSPHLTIGRVRKNASSQDKELIGKKITQNGPIHIEPFSIDKLNFTKSSLSPQGPLYSTLFKTPL